MPKKNVLTEGNLNRIPLFKPKKRILLLKGNWIPKGIILRKKKPEKYWGYSYEEFNSVNSALKVCLPFLSMGFRIYLWDTEKIGPDRYHMFILK